MEEAGNQFLKRREYWCFISYRHTNNKGFGREWATWLHHELEAYRVPPDLVGKTNNRGEKIPPQIFPVFRDEEELGGGHLKSAISEALEASKSLIVICSPQTLESSYVDEEIRTYKRLRDAEIQARSKSFRAEPIAVIIDGQPKASASDGGCIPPALDYEIDRDGIITTQKSPETLWIDLRLPDGQQGWTTPGPYRDSLEQNGSVTSSEIAKLVEAYGHHLKQVRLKLISGIIGVPFGELQKRDQAYQLKQARRRVWLLLSVILVAILGTAGGWIYSTYRYWQELHQEAQRTDIKGQIVACATSPGEEAADQQEGQLTSPYTTNLLRYLKNRDKSIVEGLISLSDEVNANSVSRQHPSIYSNMNGEVYLWDYPHSREVRALVISSHNVGFVDRTLDAPLHDGDAVHQLFLQTGIPESRIKHLRDPSRAEVEATIDDLTRNEDAANSLVFVFFSGNGAYLGADRRMILKTDGVIKSKSDLERCSLSLDETTSKLAGHYAASIFILDTNFHTDDTVTKLFGSLQDSPLPLKLNAP